MKKISFYVLCFMAACLVFAIPASAQTYRYEDREMNSMDLKGEDFASYVTTQAGTFVNAWGGGYTITASPCKWTTMNLDVSNTHSLDDRLQVGMDAAAGADVGHKQVRSYIKLEVLHDKAFPAKYTPYVYMAVVKVKGYTSFSNCGPQVDFYDTLMISYLPDNNQVYQDINMKTYYGYYSLQVQVIDVYDVTNHFYASGVPKYEDPVTNYATHTCASSLPLSGGTGWRNNYSTCEMITNWKLTAGIVYQEFVYNIPTNGIPQTSFYSNDMSNIKLEAKHDVPNLALNNLLHVSWPTDAVASFEPMPALYELEWTYVDNYKIEFSGPTNAISTLSEIDPEDLKYNFEENSTRIITDKTAYDIPLVYKRGYVVYRVRLVRPDKDLYKFSKYSEWSLDASDFIDDIPQNTQSGAGYPYYHIEDPHVADKINWNYQVSFAEEGKSKSVVSYFDGLLKNRQSLTKFGSVQNQLIATEPVYTYEGTVGLQSLPIPIIKETGTDQSLTYQPDFLLKSNNTDPFTAADIDENNAAPALGTGSKAFNYYSPANELLQTYTPGSEDHNMAKAIPNAEGYPFIQTKHAIDDPARIRVQGGAGKHLQIGKGHETKFYYMDPEQTELNQYMGLNSGKSKFYEKTITRDPNNQLSFSISNNLGKPVMTGLMQKPSVLNPPEFPIVMLDKVSPSDAVVLTTDLLYGRSQVWEGNELRLNNTYFNEGGDNTFKYNISLAGYLPCTSSSKLNVDLELEAVVQDNNTVKDITEAPNNPHVYSQDVSGDIAGSLTTTVINNMDIGECVVDYKISYKQEDVEAVVDAYLNPAYSDLTQPLDDCTESYNDFLTPELEDLPEECIWTPNALYSECAEYRNIMKSQLMPGSIYGKYAKLGTKMTVVGNDTSIFKIVAWAAKASPQPLLCDGNTYINWSTYTVNVIDNTTYRYPTPLPDPFEIGFTPRFLPDVCTNPTPFNGINYKALYDAATVASAEEWNEKWGILYDALAINFHPIYNYQKYLFDLQLATCPNFIDKAPADIIGGELNETGIEDLIEMHPEFCQADKVYCDDEKGIEFINQLEKIRDFATAEFMKLETLEYLTQRDPMFEWFNTHVASPNNTLQKFRDAFTMEIEDNDGNPNVAIPIDHYACLQTFIKLHPESVYESSNTDYDNFFSNITGAVTSQDFYINAIDNNVVAENMYYEILKSLYTGVRRRTGLREYDAPTCTPPLPLAPLNSIFRNLVNGEGGNTTDPYSPSQPSTAALSDYMDIVNAGPTLQDQIDEIGNQFDANNPKMHRFYANYIVNQLRNCVRSAAPGTLILDHIISSPTELFSGFYVPAMSNNISLWEVIRADLDALMRMNKGSVAELTWLGGITPDAVVNILNQRGVKLDDLCNPYLVSYQKSPNAQTNQGVCDLNNIWKSISESGNVAHTSKIDIMQNIKNETNVFGLPNIYQSTLYSVPLNATGSGNPVDKLDDLIHFSLGMSGSNVYTCTLHYEYHNNIDVVENLDNAITGSRKASTIPFGSPYDPIPESLEYTLTNSINTKEVKFLFEKEPTAPIYNGYYTCSNDASSCTGAAVGCTDPAHIFPADFTTDFVDIHYLLKEYSTEFFQYNASNVQDNGKFYLYGCTPDFSEGKVILNVVYKNDFHVETGGTYCPVEGYVYAFKLTITGLDLSFLQQQDCITAYEFKREYERYEDSVMAQYAIKGPQHPFYEKTLQNFYNYQFMKEHDAGKYMNFMEGAHLAMYQQVPDYYSYVQLKGSTSAISALVSWMTNTYTVTVSEMVNGTPTNVTIHPAKNIEYLRFNEGGSEDDIYIDVRSIRQDEVLKRFLLALQGYATTYSLEFDHNLLQSELPTPLTDKVVDIYTSEVIGTVPTIPNVTLTNSPYTAVTLKHDVLSSTFYKYRFTIDGGATALEVSDAIADIRDLLNDQSAFIYMATNYGTTNTVNKLADKQAYLNQAYNISPALGLADDSYESITALVKRPALLAPGNALDAYDNASSSLTYLSPRTMPADAANIDQDEYISGTLFLATQTGSLVSDGKGFLQEILGFLKTGTAGNPFSSEYICVDNALGPVSGSTTGSIFYEDADYTSSVSCTTVVNNGAFASGVVYEIKPRRQENNIYWFKLKKASTPTAPAAYYNIYIKVPDYINPRMLGAYSHGANTPVVISLKNGQYGFMLDFATAGNTCIEANSFTAYGLTDFPLDNKDVLVFDNVMLCDHDEDNGLFSPCFETLIAEAQDNAKTKYFSYIENRRTEMVTEMTRHIRENIQPVLTLATEKMKYAITLYGYDRAGNLIYTVPPEGVKQITSQTYLDAMNVTRDGGSYDTYAPTPNTTTEVPPHNKMSTYNYNSLNQLTVQNTPDGGETKFIYDPSGKLVFSQNAKQATMNRYSYTLYDDQNRIIETGETTPNSTVNTLINDLKDYVFSGALLNQANKHIRDILRGRPRSEVVCTYYDEPLYTFSTADNGMSEQQNLRGRVAAIAIYPNLGPNATSTTLNGYFTVAQHYSYDMSGNVEVLTYDMPQMDYLKQRYKRVDYDYDLYSGKVNLVSYNRGFTDQYYQRYTYDDDNRITAVSTSADGLLWDNDANYKYYPHGPLARVNLGDLRVQGIDFAYTLQGWLKAINGDRPDPGHDIGADAAGTSTVLADKLQYSLQYYANDYIAIDTTDVTNTGATNMYKIPRVPETRSLYNGNISATLSAPGNFDPLFTEYWYDQLNRIKSAQYKIPDYTTASEDYEDLVLPLATANTNADIVSNPAPPATVTVNDMYRSDYSYDLDGNLQKMQRFGVFYPAGTTGLTGGSNEPLTYLMDSLRYHYNTNQPAPNNNPVSPNNRLLDYVDNAEHNDPVTGTDFTNDLQLNANATPLTNPRYLYDAIGNLVKDNTNPKLMNTIQWSLYGKISNIDYDNGEHSSFLYEAGGNRWRKSYIKPNNAFSPDPGLTYLNEYYIREASGNILAIYKQRSDFKLEKPFFTLMEEIKPIPEAPAVLADALAANAEFATKLMSYINTYENAYMVSMTSAKDPSYYLLNSSAMKLAMVQNSDDLVEDLLGTEPDLFTDVLASPDANMFAPLLYETNGTILTNHIYNLADTNSLTMMQALVTSIGHTKSISDVAGFVDAVKGRINNLTNTAFTSALAGYYNGTSSNTWTPTVLRMLNDSLYLNKTYSTFSYQKVLNFVLSMVGTSGNDTVLSAYYDGMSGTAVGSILNAAATTQERAELIFMTEPEAVITAMTAEDWFSDAMDEALSKTSSIAFLQFANMMIANADVGTTVGLLLQEKLQNDRYTLAEHHLYGSSRLGIKTYWPTHYEFNYESGGTTTWEDAIANNQLLSLRRPWYSQKLNSLIRSNETVPYGNANNDHVNSSRQLGQKHYELTNHLGNVMAVITDKITDSTATNSVSDVLPLDSYPKASLYASYDYYPFGMLMPERYYEDQTLMCTPVTKTVYNTYWYPLDQQVITSPSVPGGFTLTSTGTASMSVNSSNQIVVSTSSSSAPKTTTLSYEVSSGIEAFKGVKLSVPVTNSTSNTLNVSLQQLNEDSEWEAFASTTVASSTSLELEGIPTSNTAVKIVFGGTNAGFKIGPVMQFERHDLLAGTQIVEICNQDDDFKDDYRFGFNGQHKDNEIKGIGNSLDYKARIQDTRLGRFLSIDPLTKQFPMLTPYQFASNTPIRATDLDGKEADFSFFYRQIWGATGITKQTEANINNRLKEFGESKVGKATNGAGNVVLGTVGAVGSVVYVAGTDGAGAAAGGSVALSASFAQIGLGFVQMADAFGGGGNDNLQESGSFAGYVMRERGVPYAPLVDATVQFIPGFLSGGNLKTLINAPGEILSSTSPAKAVYNAIDAYDAFGDTKDMITESVNASMDLYNKFKSDLQKPNTPSQKSNTQTKPPTTTNHRLTKKEVSDIKNFVQKLKNN